MSGNWPSAGTCYVSLIIYYNSVMFSFPLTSRERSNWFEYNFKYSKGHELNLFRASYPSSKHDAKRFARSSTASDSRLRASEEKSNTLRMSFPTNFPFSRREP